MSKTKRSRKTWGPVPDLAVIGQYGTFMCYYISFMGHYWMFCNCCTHLYMLVVNNRISRETVQAREVPQLHSLICVDSGQLNIA